MLLHKNITYVDKHWEHPHRNYEENLSTCDKLQRYFCCDKRNKIFYDYLNHLEELELELVNKSVNDPNYKHVNDQANDQINDQVNKSKLTSV